MELPVSCKNILLFWFTQLNLGYIFNHRVGGVTYRATTYVKVLAKMECTYWTYSINHHIPYSEMTSLTIQLATAWTNYAYF